MPALTARSTVAAGELVSHTHMARVSAGVAVTVALPLGVVRVFDAAAASGAIARAAAATPTATSSEPATRPMARRGRRVRGEGTM
ncbi:hypothetical protein GCM10027039_37400 [Terrabacter koreensis]